MSRQGPVAGITWLQLIAGALAAMTSAWVASYLGVAGTIIGAAVGSLVASIASALYVSGLNRSTTFITESGSVVARREPAGESQEVVDGDDLEVLTTRDESAVAVDELPGAFSWRRVLIWTGAALASSLMLIVAFEMVTDSSFGQGDNPTITRPFSGPADSSSEPDPSQGTTRPTDEPTTAATTVPTTAPTTEPTAEASTEPTAEPTTEAPAEPAPDQVAPEGP